jgi:hypothetical protein
VPVGIAGPRRFAVRRTFEKENQPMSLLPHVTERARELVAREFDARGPAVCMIEIIEHLKKTNPELLDMADKWAANLGNPAKAMLGFGIFYRLHSGAPRHRSSDPAAARERRDARAVGEGNR